MSANVSVSRKAPLTRLAFEGGNRRGFPGCDLSRKKFLPELFDTLVGALITRLGVAQMFSHQVEIVPKARKVALQAAYITDDFLGARLDLHPFETQHDGLGSGGKTSRRNPNHPFAER